MTEELSVGREELSVGRELSQLPATSARLNGTGSRVGQRPPTSKYGMCANTNLDVSVNHLAASGFERTAATASNPAKRVQQRGQTLWLPHTPTASH